MLSNIIGGNKDYGKSVVVLWFDFSIYRKNQPIGNENG